MISLSYYNEASILSTHNFKIYAAFRKIICISANSHRNAHIKNGKKIENLMLIDLRTHICYNKINQFNGG